MKLSEMHGDLNIIRKQIIQNQNKLILAAGGYILKHHPDYKIDFYENNRGEGGHEGDWWSVYLGKGDEPWDDSDLIYRKMDVWGDGSTIIAAVTHYKGDLENTDDTSIVRFPASIDSFKAIAEHIASNRYNKPIRPKSKLPTTIRPTGMSEYGSHGHEKHK